MNPYSTEVHAMNAVRSTGWAGRVARIAATVALLAPIVNCTSRQNAGTSPAYLIVDSLLAASGATPTSFGGNLASDVLTKNSIMADNAQLTLRVALKDPGSQTTPNQPTTMNFITVTRYHVRFFRTDGRNTQGVDVPREFDGAVTGTVDETGGVLNFTLVRVQAKAEAPLQALSGLLTISTIAEVTVYGTDQAGRAVSVTGTISVNFANWADPA